tara:strand:+ start:51 stop:569 length:519 start_codon:yes stop_codon:yes gene_type:complete
MQRFGNIIKQINRRNKMETETFECTHKMAFASKDGGGKYSIYVTKDDGIDMTVYGEAIGAERWQKGARLKVIAQPVRTSKNGKQYQTARSVELLGGEVAVPSSNMVSAKGVQAVRDISGQWKEKYRLTMSNLLSAAITSGKEVNYDEIDGYVRKILNAKMDSVEDLPADAPF